MEFHVEGEDPPAAASARRSTARPATSTTPTPSPALFSFNHPVGACETCKGFGRTMAIDPDLVVPDPRKTIHQGCVKPFQTTFYSDCQDDLERFCRARGAARRRALRGAARRRRSASSGRASPAGAESWQRKWYGIAGFFEWLESRTYRMHVRVFLSRYRSYGTCPDCGGRAAQGRGAALPASTGGRCPRSRRCRWPRPSASSASGRCPGSDPASEQLLHEIRGRLRFLVDIGLGYLTLGRQSRTLSGGEAQRVTLATALGGSLTSTLYVLDEPSVGLHPRDAARLVRRAAAAGGRRQRGGGGRARRAPSSRRADHVIDLGPGPGREGGEVVYEGPVAGLLDGAPLEDRRRTSPGDSRRPRPRERRAPDPQARSCASAGARENNLKDVTVDVPLGLLVCVTGVSGSGKSSLVDQVLHRNLRRQFGLGESEPGACDGIDGAAALTGVTLVDQAPLGRVLARQRGDVHEACSSRCARSSPRTPEARERGLKPTAFSFNSAAGACPVCEGAGYEKVEMQFLPDAFVKCGACDGRRFRPEVLEVRVQGPLDRGRARPARGRRGAALRRRPRRAPRRSSRCSTSASATSRSRSRRRRSPAARPSG